MSEVLISLLVMSIGVVSLATLFPISVLRAVQATQLTNAANLRYNVEALLGVRPELFSVGQSWVAGTNYATGALVTPMELTSLKSPSVVFLCTTAGTSMGIEPTWNFNDGAITPDGPVLVWTTFRLQNCVIDPLGAYLVESTFRQPAVSNPGEYFFGNDSGANTARRVIRAFSGGAANVAIADDAATLPDSWLNQGESKQISGLTATSCTLGDLQDNLVTPTSTNAFPQSRIVMFDITGKVSHVRPIYNITGTAPTQTVDWTPPAGVPSSGPLPSGFIPVQARIESKERRYTWMLSVRRAFSGASYMDVVVFFRRPFSGKDEQVYPATFTATTDFGFDRAPGISGIDDDGNTFIDVLPSGFPDPAEVGAAGSDDAPRNWVVVQYDAAGDKPFVKKGGFVTDADNLRWYRIIDIVEGDALNGFTPSGVMQKAGLVSSGLNPYPAIPPYLADGAIANYKSIFLRVEDQISQSGPQPTGGPGGTPNGRAMIMRGIVDVYPIRTHLTWEN